MDQARSIGIGVIGMGWMGVVHSRAYRMLADRFHSDPIKPRLVICADDVELRAREAQRRFGFEQYTTDWRHVVAHPDVQVVNIASPNHLHVEMAQAAAAAGKHIFCEKPVGRNSSETAAIARAASQAGILSGVGYNYRWAPLVQYARQLIRDGKLGSLTHYRGRFLVDYGSHPDAVLSWRFQRELAGYGTLGDLMSHVADMAHMLAGRIERVVASRRKFITSRPTAVPGSGTHFSVNPDAPRGEVTNEDHVAALVQFASGAQGNLEVCRVVKGPRCEMAFELNGTRGAVKWSFERMNELQLFLPDGTPEHDGPVLIQAGPHHPFYSPFYPGPGISMSYEDLKAIEAWQFLRSVMGGRQGEPGFTEALAVAEVQDAMERSWQSERWEDVHRLSDA
jgi:predicted dehydrogenase